MSNHQRQIRQMTKKKSEKVQIEVGFIGGPAFVGKIETSEFEKLVKAVTKGDEWHELSLEDGQVTLNLKVVSYVKSIQDQTSIGF